MDRIQQLSKFLIVYMSVMLDLKQTTNLLVVSFSWVQQEQAKQNLLNNFQKS